MRKKFVGNSEGSGGQKCVETKRLEDGKNVTYTKLSKNN